jgi:exopolysaccharide/PEP-CTERM locus tyrosine autokinase
MSRLEKALEKASKMKEEKRDTGETAKSITETASYEHFKTEVPLEIHNPYLVTVTDPQSPVAEEYRKLKSMIVERTKGDAFQNTIMVTSTAKAEGKSITAINLAITLAQDYDNTVLLVDADLRQPTIHKYLNINNEIGLSDCLTKGAKISDALVKTGIGKLMVLPSGSNISNPVELLSSNMMTELIRELKNRYEDRYVIIDTPPILPFAEAHSIGQVVDGAILVIREGIASSNHIKDVLRLLKGVNIFGIVYNGAEIDRFDGHYYYYYKSYHSHNGNTHDGGNKKRSWLQFLRRNKQ